MDDPPAHREISSILQVYIELGKEPVYHLGLHQKLSYYLLLLAEWRYNHRNDNRYRILLRYLCEEPIS